MLRGIKIGAPEMAVLSTVVDNAEPKFGVFEMPYIIANRAHMKKVAEHPRVQSAIFEGLPAKGMRVLGVWENGLRHVTSNVRPIEKPEDLKGLKLRVPAGAWWVKLFKAYGASPSTIPTAELFKALQSNVVDSQEAPFPIIAAERLQEVQKYLSLTSHAYSPALLLISEETWKKLPPDVQATLSKIGWDMGNFARSEGERLDKDLLKKLAPPMKLNEVNKEPFIKASAVVYEEFGQQVPGGRELIGLIQSLR
jgi:tripartite ATP-independent transporter DctP family solute receptor